MKPFPRRIHRPPRRSFEPAPAYTLPEVLVSMALLSLLLGALIYGNLFGLKLCEVSKNKLNAGDDARKVLEKITDEIRNAKIVWVGSVANGFFQEAALGDPQSGSAVLVCPTTNTGIFSVYFLDPSDQTLRRTTSSGDTVTVLAHSITNSAVFQAQDCLGNVLADNHNNRTIHIKLQIYQPQVQAPTPDHFTLETAVTRRVLE
jgi:prepilin-type N-terminal cleavage/methylation domain-containing protein